MEHYHIESKDLINQATALLPERYRVAFDEIFTFDKIEYKSPSDILDETEQADGFLHCLTECCSVDFDDIEPVYDVLSKLRRNLREQKREDKKKEFVL